MCYISCATHLCYKANLALSYRHTNYPDMLDTNDYYHSGHITYQGTAGKYYKAYVCIWAGKDGDGDTRYYWTSSKKAT